MKTAGGERREYHPAFQLSEQENPALRAGVVFLVLPVRQEDCPAARDGLLHLLTKAGKRYGQENPAPTAESW